MYLTTEEAAAYLGLSKHTLNQWRSRGRGPSYSKLGSLVRYARADLDAWAQQHRVRTRDAA